jgi:hypothetical protein
MRAQPCICALLIVSMALLPADVARAGLISSDRAIPSDAQTYRQTVIALLKRPEVLRQLELLGVEQTLAEARVAAMTDEEALELVSKLESLPAGGQMGPSGGGGGAGGGAVALLLILLIIFIIWWQIKKGEPTAGRSGSRSHQVASR